MPARAVASEDLGSIYPTDFTISNVPIFLARGDDRWDGILAAKGDLAAELARAG